MENKTCYIAVYSNKTKAVFCLINENDEIYAIHTCNNNDETIKHEAYNIYNIAHGVDPTIMVTYTLIDKIKIYTIKNWLEFFIFVGGPQSNVKNQIVLSRKSKAILDYSDIYNVEPETVGLRILTYVLKCA